MVLFITINPIFYIKTNPCLDDVKIQIKIFNKIIFKQFLGFLNKYSGLDERIYSTNYDLQMEPNF